MHVLVLHNHPVGGAAESPWPFTESVQDLHCPLCVHSHSARGALETVLEHVFLQAYIPPQHAGRLPYIESC